MNEERYPITLMTEDEIDEYDNTTAEFTQWDIADAVYNAERRGVQACLDQLYKWQRSGLGKDITLSDCIALLQKL